MGSDRPEQFDVLQFDVLIVGSGHGGAQAAIALKQHGFSGTVGLLGDEPDLPYERPPLSKGYLTGERTAERLLLRPATFWTERGVALLPGRRITGVDPAARTVATDAGETFGYGTLIWAAGGRARRMICSGHDLASVHTIRNRADVDRLREELESTQRVVVIGGGYIGLEAAASLRSLTKDVTVVEALDRVLARVAGEPLSRFFEAEHRAQGVHILLDTKVECIEAANGRVTGVKLVGGRIVAADMVIVGIGIVPNVEPLLAAGARGENGVAVDEFCRTSLPHVYAIGDCALHANAFAEGRALRLESVQNATDMAATVASVLTGNAAAYHSVPWFWSNQYDIRLQTVGLSTHHDAIIVRGAPSSRSFSLIYCQRGAVIALDCVNAAKDYMQGRALVMERRKVEPHLLADPQIPLRSLQG